MLPRDHTLSRFSYFYRGEDPLIYESIVACKVKKKHQTVQEFTRNKTCIINLQNIRYVSKSEI
jgi:hypothetical protein